MLQHLIYDNNNMQLLSKKHGSENLKKPNKKYMWKFQVSSRVLQNIFTKMDYIIKLCSDNEII